MANESPWHGAGSPLQGAVGLQTGRDPEQRAYMCTQPVHGCTEELTWHCKATSFH